MAAITGVGIGIEIARALGLPPETTDIQINIGMETPVTVVCRYYPDAAAMERVLAIVRRYHLHEVELPPPVSPEHAAARERDREIHDRIGRLERLRARSIFHDEPSASPQEP